MTTKVKKCCSCKKDHTGDLNWCNNCNFKGAFYDPEIVIISVIRK